LPHAGKETGGCQPVAEALVLPANSVGAKQLKKSAVTKVKIKANAVTGAKVKDESLTGADILESSLGKVPSATNADNATHANNADSATNATNATHANNADSATNADNANTVGGYAASLLNRVAIGSGSVMVTSGSPSVSVATVTITAPTTGFVLVHGTSRRTAALALTA
jgi:hypothetical protein